MKKNKSDKILGYALPVITVVCLIVIWWALAAAVGNGFILPDPVESVNALFALLKTGEFYVALSLTLVRSLIAFVVSFSAAAALAFLSDRYKSAKKVIKPIIGILRALPTVAVVLLLLLWTNSFIAPMIVTALVVLPTIFTNVEAALQSIDKESVEACVFFGLPQKEIKKRVIVPQIAPQMLLSAGSGLSLNLKLMVAAEVLSQTARSLGYLLNTAKVYLETAQMIAVVLITVIIGVGIESAFSALSKKSGRWQE